MTIKNNLNGRCRNYIFMWGMEIGSQPLYKEPLFERKNKPKKTAGTHAQKKITPEIHSEITSAKLPSYKQSVSIRTRPLIQT